MSGGAISRLAARMGILRRYRDFNRVERRTTAATDRALLAAMGTPVETARDAEDRLRALDAAVEARIGPPEAILPAGAPARVAFRRAAAWSLRLEGEAGAAAEGAGATAELPPLPVGVHRLALDAPGGEETVWLLAAPGAAPSLAGLTGASRVWGIAAALYGLRSSRNAGLGDYRDLGEAAASAARQGAAFLGVNPVHAVGAAAPEGLISPYSPTHRGFLNPWHVALDSLAPFCGEDVAPSADARAAARRSALVDYAAAAALRAPALGAAHAAFARLGPDHPARRAFDRFSAERGAPLAAFARFEALSLRHGPDWRDWPAALRDPESPAVAEFARANPGEVERCAWLQWVADAQLAEAQGTARAAGMRLGLYLDLAVGARPGGAETWMDRAGHVLGATLGAPPDAFGEAGQNWGLAPLNPHGLAAGGYAGFRGLLAASMRCAGAMRIDHAIGLMRSYWRPDAGEPGAYVRYPLDSLLAVIAIEAERRGTLVVGEDLGLVPRGLRRRLARAGLYGLEVLQFERGAAGGLPAPEELRRRAIASFGTHDTPTIEGFFAGEDLRWRERLGELDAAGCAAAMCARATLIARLGAAPGPALRRRVHGDLARSRAELVAVQLDDLAGETAQQNLPGTVDEHPNWRRRAPVAVEEMDAWPPLAETAALMRDAGRA